MQISNHVYKATVCLIVFLSSNSVFSQPNDFWEQTNFDFQFRVQTLAINSSGDIFVAASDSGVFRSTDNGSSWLKINSGLNDTIFNAKSFRVWSLALSPSEQLFAGTDSSGIFRSVNSTTTTVQENNASPKFFSLSQNYPNPFNPTTTIPYSLKRHSNVSLKVYDVIGREVAVLVNEFQSPGDYAIEFDARDFANGVYVYRLQAGDLVEAKRFILVK
jgi:hypothetical protein